MSTVGNDTAPGVGQLFGEALEAWTARQGLFWRNAAGVAGTLAVFQFVIESGWIGSRNQAVTGSATAFVYAFVLDYFFKHFLFPDWPERAKVLAKARSRQAGLGMGFLGFCAIFVLAVTILSLVAIIPMIDFAAVSRGEAAVAVVVAAAMIQPPVMAIVTIAMGGFLLFLPARSTSTDITLVGAWRLGQQVRGRMILFALLCVVLLVVSYGVVIATSLLRLPDTPFVSAVVRGVVSLIDAFVLFVLAHGLSALFRRQAAWTPPPMPSLSR